MDKYEYKVKADEIKNLISQGEYSKAAEIADEIDWRRVKSVMMLCTISDLYKLNRRYEDARDILKLAYERRPGGRNIVYSLCELCLKTGEFVQALEYFKEFCVVAGNDPGKYILKYKIYEAQDASLEERISVLEELKAHDFREKWAYELAYLYHRVGLATKCVETCDEMILWFGEGKYVIKAMELKMLHQPLTPAQKEKYENRFSGEKKELSSSSDTKIYEGSMLEEEQPEISVNVGQFNTMNMQAEIAANIRELFENEENAAKSDAELTKTIFSPMLDSDTESFDASEIDEVSEDDIEEKGNDTQTDEPEVFFGSTGELVIPDREVTEYKLGKDEKEDDDDMFGSTANILKAFEIDDDPTGQAILEQMKLENVTPEETVIAEEPPRELADVLSEDSNGQISMVVPEEETVEKQITGQMSIEDILAEWEKMKKENEEKRAEEVRKHVIEQTGTMFTEFEASVRDGLLEKLENGEIESVDEITYDDLPDDEVEEIAEVEEDGSLEGNEEIIGEEIPEEEVSEEEIPEEEIPEEEVSEEEIPEEEIPEEEITGEEVPEEETAHNTSEEEKIAENDAEKEKPVEEQQLNEQETGENESAHKTASHRSLTRDEKALYGPFIQSKRARAELVNAIDAISLAPYTGNLMITGDEGVNTMGLAKSVAKEIQLTDSNFSGKVAKISGTALNKRDLSEMLESLNNGAIIIQKVSGLDEKTTGELKKAMMVENRGLIVIIEDTKKGMNSFLSKHEDLAEFFTAKINVEALSNDTLALFGTQYAKEKGYSIDTMGILALHTKIEELQTIDHAVDVIDVKRIIDAAISHANKKSLGHFLDVVFSKRYDDEDMIVLGEKDFN